MDITQNLCDNIEDKVGIDIQSFLIRFNSFIENFYPSIIAYYQGGILNQVAFDRLSLLTEESKNNLNIMTLNKNLFTTVEYWDLMTYLEDINTKLQTIKNIPAYLRTSLVNGTNNPNYLVDYTTRQFENLETVISNFGSTDKNADWVDLSLSNNLREEDYTPAGGVLLKVELRDNIQLSDSKNILDTIIGDSVYGKDFNKKLTITDNDLETLEPSDTFIQTVEIFGGLKKGDNPEFPDEGYTQIAGTELSALNYPTLFREIISTVAQDDTIKTVSITDLKREDDAVYAELDFESQLGLIQTAKLVI